jgi:hypothetical protein
MVTTVTYANFVASLDDSEAGAAAYAGVVVEDGVAKQTPAINLGEIPRLAANSSRNLTINDVRAGIITSYSSGTTVLKLPTFYELGWTRDSGNPVELCLMFERGGTGALFVNPSLYLGSVASQAAMLALNPTEIGDFCKRSDVSNHFFMHTSGDGDSAGHWTDIGSSATNIPTTAGVAIEWNDLDPSTRPQWGAEVLLKTNGHDSWYAV